MTSVLDQVQEKLDELIDAAEGVAEEAENYLEVATAIDNAKKGADPRDYVPLDDLPYGEERARLGGAPDALRDLISDLKILPIASLSISEIDQRIEEAQEQIDDVKSTIDDCTDLPADDDDDDDFPL